MVADISEAGNRKTARLIEGLGVKALAMRCDVTRVEDVKAALDSTVEAFGRLDCTFNNAGVMARIAPTADSIRGLDRVINVTVERCTRSVTIAPVRRRFDLAPSPRSSSL